MVVPQWLSGRLAKKLSLFQMHFSVEESSTERGICVSASSEGGHGLLWCLTGGRTVGDGLLLVPFLFSSGDYSFFVFLWDCLDFYWLVQVRRPVPLSRLIWQTKLESCRVWCGFVQQKPGPSVRLCAFLYFYSALREHGNANRHMGRSLNFKLW